MKIPAILRLALLTLAMAPAPCLAAGRGEVYGGLTGGVVLPTGSLRGITDPGFLGGGTFDYLLSERLAVGVSVNVHRMPLTGTSAGIGGGSRLGLLQFGPQIRWFPAGVSRPGPYFGAGVAAYDFRVKSAPGTDQCSGANAAAGYSLPVNGGVQIRLEAAGHLVATTGRTSRIVGVSAAAVFRGAAPW